jgi:hypothetical protein
LTCFFCGRETCNLLVSKNTLGTVKTSRREGEKIAAYHDSAGKLTAIKCDVWRENNKLSMELSGLTEGRVNDKSLVLDNLLEKIAILKED